MKNDSQILWKLYLTLLIQGTTGFAFAARPLVPAPVPFKVGEEIVLGLGWKSAKAGEAVIGLKEIRTRQGRPAYHAELALSTNRAIDAVFAVRDRIESWVDASALKSLGYTKLTREGTYQKDEFIFLDGRTGIYRYRRMRPDKGGKPREDAFQAPLGAQDALSALYNLRAQSLEVGHSVDFKVIDGDEIRAVRVAVRARETVSTPAGTFPCLKLEPLFKTADGWRAHPKAQIYMWISDDARRLPVKIAGTLPFGEVGAELERYQ